MKAIILFSVVTASVLVFSVSGCKKEAKIDATQSLEESFSQAEPEVQQAVQTINTSLQEGSYAEAAKAMEPILDGRPLTQQQQEAVALAFGQINQAIQSDPSLDTKEMHELRTRMFKSAYKGD